MGVKHSKRERYEIVIELLRKPKQSKEIAYKYNIGVSTLYKWRNRFLDGGMDSLEPQRTGPQKRSVITNRERELEHQLKEKEKRINQLATEIEVLKKNENWESEGLP
jgi:transposase